MILKAFEEIGFYTQYMGSPEDYSNAVDIYVVSNSNVEFILRHDHTPTYRRNVYLLYDPKDVKLVKNYFKFELKFRDNEYCDECDIAYGEEQKQFLYGNRSESVITIFSTSSGRIRDNVLDALKKRQININQWL